MCVTSNSSLTYMNELTMLQIIGPHLYNTDEKPQYTRGIVSKYIDFRPTYIIHDADSTNKSVPFYYHNCARCVSSLFLLNHGFSKWLKRSVSQLYIFTSSIGDILPCAFRLENQL
jgi:hypothetical protein